MKRKMLSGKELIKLGYPEGKAVGLVINAVLKYFRIAAIKISLRFTVVDLFVNGKGVHCCQGLLHGDFDSRECVIIGPYS